MLPIHQARDDAPPMPPPPATKLNDWEIDVIEAWAKPMALLP